MHPSDDPSSHPIYMGSGSAEVWPENLTVLDTADASFGATSCLGMAKDARESVERAYRQKCLRGGNPSARGTSHVYLVGL